MSEFRRFQGTAHYESTRSKNAYTFAVPYLRRNIRRALDYQQYDLLLERGHDPARDAGGFRDNYDEEECNANWDFPPATMLNDIIKGLEPTVCVDKLLLRHEKSARVIAAPHRPRAGRAGSPDWLPDESEWKVPCQVAIRLLYQTEPKRMVHHEIKFGNIVRHDHPTKDPSFEIVLDSAIKIPLGKFEVMVEYKDSKGDTQWKLAREDQKVHLDFRIQCKDSADSAHLLSQLERRNISEYIGASADDSEMRITWKNLPTLPASGTLLELKRTQRRKPRFMHYKADVSATWSQECQPLAAWNRAWQLQQQEAARQLPTPSVSDDFERPRKMRVQYLTRRTTFQAKCATERGLHCVVSSCHDRAEHSSLERLMLHYAIHHDHMKFEINADRSDDNLAVIFISAADDASGSFSREFDWEAPRSAFDIKAHLNGTKPWAVTNVKGKERSVKNTPQKSPKKRGPVGQSNSIPITLGRPKPIIRRPEDVLDLPVVPRKRHKVPKVENISFYRTLSKQQVAAWDEISDSEEEADTEWAVQAQRREQTFLGIDPVTQDFNEAFNKHLDREQPMSNLFTQHAAVRFARQNVPLLSDQWRELFHEKLKQFEDKRIISPETVTYCMGLLTTEPARSEAGDRGNNTPSGRTHNEQGRSSRRPTDSATRTPERRSARSPPASQMSTKSRVRWSHGKMSQQQSDPTINGAHRSALDSPTPGPASQSRRDIPFGRRRVICRRGNKKIGTHHIYDFVRDDRQDVPHDELRPSELELAKLLRVLGDEMAFNRGTDVVVCISNGKAKPIVDEDDWMSALKDIEVNAPPGDIVFELRSEHIAETSANERPNGKRKQGEGSTGPAKKKVRIQKEPLCVCGEKAEGLRGTMMCGNCECTGKFHLKCLGLEQRPVDEWLCPECR